jgi:glycosyltransferase involved in cell wall biosynthesis
MNKYVKYMAIIPAYNEAKNITPVVTKARSFLPVLVVDDGSTDNTSDLAEAAGAEVLRHSSNQGKGAALRSGFLHTLDLGCEAVITLDADGQHDPFEIHKFLQIYTSRPVDLIIGQRDFRKMPLTRRIANTSGGWLFSWAIGRPIPDNQSGYRLLSRNFITKLLDSTEEGFEFEVEMLVICLKQHFDLEWVQIRTIYAGQSSHINPLTHLRNFLRMAWVAHQSLQHAW